MKAKIEIELQPFTVPNFVRTKSLNGGDDGETAIVLQDLDPLTLDRLCEQFARDVFKKSGKTRPDQQAPLRD